MAAKIKEPKDEKPKSSKSILGGILKDHKDEHYNFHERVDWRASTGSLLVDVATGGVRPSMWRLAGNNNSGKTPQCLEIIRNIFKSVPNSKAVWFFSEGRGLSDENKERCGLKFVYSEEEWDEHTVFVFETNTFELFIKTVRELVLNNPEQNRYAFCLDSLDGMTLRGDKDKEIDENNKVAGVPAMSKKMMQSLSLGMFKFGHWLGIVSQVTAEIKLDQYSKTPDRGGQFSGGNSLLHGSDIILQYEPSFGGDFILDSSGRFNDGKTKPIGQNVRVVLVKSILEEYKKTKITYPIKYGRRPSGIWLEKELADLVLGWEMGKKAGAGWITMTPAIMQELLDADVEFPEKIQGVDNIAKELETNSKALEFFQQKFFTLLS